MNGNYPLTVCNQAVYADRIRYIQKFSPKGTPYGVYEDSVVQRIHEQFLDIAIYLYLNERAARTGLAAGGSGFLVWVESETYPELRHYYAVTNQHVIEDGAK